MLVQESFSLHLIDNLTHLNYILSSRAANLLLDFVIQSHLLIEHPFGQIL